MTKTVVMYGSLREGADSKTLAEHTVEHLYSLGAEVKLYDPKGLPLFDYESYDHPKVVELFDLGLWADSYVWISPEYHGGTSGVLKNQIDWLPCRDRAVKATKDKIVALMSTTGGLNSFNTINSLAINARWLKMPVAATHVNWPQPYYGYTEGVDNRVRDAAQNIIDYTK